MAIRFLFSRDKNRLIMVIYLSGELITKGIEEEGFFIFLRNMMIAYSEGKHIIVIAPKDVKSLLKLQNLDAFTKEYLKSYNSHNKDIMGVLEMFSVVIKVINLAESEKIIYDRDLKCSFRCIIFEKFLDTSSIQKTVLLGENANDCDVYSLFSEYFKQYNNLTSFKVNFKRQGGGGSTIVNEYSEIHSKKEVFCLCVLDSDKRTPKKKYGSTAMKVFNFHNSSLKNLKCDFLIIPALEVENLFPEKFYRYQYIRKYPVEILPSLKKIEKNLPFARKYFDFKKGVSCFAAQTDQGVVDFWYNLVFEANLKCREVNDNTHCYIEGFGENILIDFLNYDRKEIFEFVKSDIIIDKVWLKLGAIMSSFILSPEIKRAI